MNNHNQPRCAACGQNINTGRIVQNAIFCTPCAEDHERGYIVLGGENTVICLLPTFGEWALHNPIPEAADPQATLTPEDTQ